MLVVRPVRSDDLELLYELSSHAKIGLTTLPHDKEILQNRIDNSIKSFETKVKKPGGETYLFVMEDCAQKTIVGSCAIVSKVGGYEPFYTYELKTNIRESRILNVRKENQYLQLLKIHDGPSEIGTLFLKPDFRQKGSGRLLSLSRFMFLAEYPELFESSVLAEMRGVFDENNNSPFWEYFGRHFFDIEFQKADLMGMADKTFIYELMPEHPIYVKLLHEEAQKVIGKVHKNTEPALKMLEDEGFKFKNEVDIFEAGPVMEANIENIRSVKESRVADINEIKDSIDTELFMITAANEFENFKVVMGNLEEMEDGINITGEVAKVLDVQGGDKVRYVALRKST